MRNPGKLSSGTRLFNQGGVLLVLSIVFFTAGCAKLQPDEIVARAVDAAPKVNTYKSDTDMSLEAGHTAGFSIKSDTSGTFLVDNVKRQSQGETSMGDLAYDFYIVEGVLYMYYGGYTFSSPLTSTEDWESSNQNLNYSKMLKSATKVTSLGTEKVNGIESYVLEITPEVDLTGSELVALTMPFNPFFPIGAEETLSSGSPDDTYKMILRYWIDKKTFLFNQVEIVFSFSAEIGAHMALTSKTRLYDYNKDVTISLPPEATKAPSSTASATTRGNEEAARTELSTIQSAVIAMMVDNLLLTLPHPVTSPTNNMGAFPDPTSDWGTVGGKTKDTNGNAYRDGDKAGYLLYQYDKIGDGRQTGLVDYVAEQHTKGTYTIDAFGTVTQVTTGYE